MRLLRWLLLSFLLLASTSTACCYNLIIMPASERTHMMVLLKLAAELAIRNNTVYFVTAECHQQFATEQAARHLDGRAERLHWITYNLNCTHHKQELMKSQLAHPAIATAKILRGCLRRLEDLMDQEPVLEQIKSLSPDLMVTDVMSFGMVVSVKLGIRNVDFDAGTAGSLFEPSQYGAEAPAAYIPAVGTTFPTTGMSFWQRAINAVVYKLAHAAQQWALYNHNGWMMQICKRHNVHYVFPYDHYMLLLVNSHFVMEAPRAIAPNTKYIGPMLPEPARPLPEPLQMWLDGSGQLGCVFISFGVTLQSPLAACRTITRAIQSMSDVRFVWSLPTDQQQALASELSALNNVHIGAWLPQNDLLGHPKMRAFVTQGGYLSMGEAAYHGVPILGLPFITGQGEIIQYAQDTGRGLRLPGDTLVKGDAGAFRDALMQLLSVDSFKAAASIASKRLRAVPRRHVEEAAEWVEYAAALKDEGPFLHPQKMYQSWWQQAMLDVVLFYHLLIATLAYCVWRLVSGLARARSPGCHTHTYQQDDQRTPLLKDD